jgi:Ketopantoate hydroxymethyltransferase
LAKNDGEVQSVVADALAVEKAGAFAVVVEAVRLDLSTQLEAAVKIPTIGIGAGPLCDGQILVAEDMLGFFEGNPKFVRRYAELGHLVQEAVTRYADDVRSGAFPSEKESYK